MEGGETVVRAEERVVARREGEVLGEREAEARREVELIPATGRADRAALPLTRPASVLREWNEFQMPRFRLTLFRKPSPS